MEYTSRQMNKEKHTFSINDNFLLGAILMLAICGYMVDAGFIRALIWFLIVMISYGNIKHIFSHKYLGATRFVRRILFLVPLFAIVIYGVDIKANLLSAWCTIVGVLAIGIYYFIYRRSWRLALCEDVLLRDLQTFNQHITSILYSIGASVGEELFFRGFLIGHCYTHWSMIFVSAFMFMVFHIGNKWGTRFKVSDAVHQIIFGILFGTFYYFSQSIVPCIICHFLFNTPYILIDIKKINLLVKKQGNSKHAG